MVSTFRVFAFDFAFMVCFFLLIVGGTSQALASSPLVSVRPSFVEHDFQLELGLTETRSYRIWRTYSPSKVVVDIEATRDDELPAAIPIDDAAVRQVRVGTGPLGVRVVVDLAFPVPFPSAQYDETSLIVRIPIRFQTIEEIFIRPGVSYGSVRGGQEHGPVSAKYLKVDLNHPTVFVDVAGSEVFGLKTLRTLVSASGALGGINGSYFHWTGRPLGLLIKDGRLISQDVYGRAALTVGKDGTVQITHQSVEMSLSVSGQHVPVHGINRPRSRGEIVVYTTEFGPLGPPAGERVVVNSEQNFIVEFDDSAPSESTTLLRSLDSDDVVQFLYRLTPGHPGGVRMALGAGPMLVSDGKVNVTGIEERFKPDVFIGRAPRTAVGITAANEILFVVVDGRNPGNSHGLTLDELAQFLIDLGAVSAMNLDGGGSSTLVLRDLVLNEPSMRDERPIGNGLFVFVQEEN